MFGAIESAHQPDVIAATEGLQASLGDFTTARVSLIWGNLMERENVLFSYNPRLDDAPCGEQTV